MWGGVALRDGAAAGTPNPVSSKKTERERKEERNKIEKKERENEEKTREQRDEKEGEQREKEVYS